MNCEQARLLIGAEPRSAAPELAEHLKACAACAQLREEMLAFETRIERALQSPPDIARRPMRAAQWRPWALAASVLFATLAGVGVWLLRPSDSLAHDVVTHVQHEPDSWLAARQLNAQSIGGALHGAGVALDLTSDKITYAQSCWFHGHYVPTLVVNRAGAGHRAHPAPRAGARRAQLSRGGLQRHHRAGHPGQHRGARPRR